MADLPTGRPRAVLIAGPTASGKSALALALAAAIGGEIVNADSMQVYRELSILTARPSGADLAAAPHHLYGHVAAVEGYTVARWLDDVRVLLPHLAAEGRTAILVGGTGLYFTALTEGLSDVPAVPQDVRDQWRAAAAKTPAAELHRLLAMRDPVMAGRLRPSDGQRVIRALEVLEATGRSLEVFQERRGPAILPAAETVRLVVAPERVWLHRRIEERFRAMVSAGAVEEARRFAALRLDPALPAMKAIGVPDLLAHAEGRVGLDAAIAAAVVATRRYAKRQETWFRNQMPDWRRIDPARPEAAAEAISALAR